METCCIMNIIPIWVFILIGVLVVWEMVWKIVAIWKAGRNNHLGWFLCIVFLNTLGILPIVYILMHRKKRKPLT